MTFKFGQQTNNYFQFISSPSWSNFEKHALLSSAAVQIVCNFSFEAGAVEQQTTFQRFSLVTLAETFSISRTGFRRALIEVGRENPEIPRTCWNHKRHQQNYLILFLFFISTYTNL